MELKDTVIGIELGSTRIKAVLLSDSFEPLAAGSFSWENQLVDGVWTYPEGAMISGLQSCFADLKGEVLRKYGIPLNTAGAIGISAMMHGYLVQDKDGALLSEFRTWRNTMTAEAAEYLTGLFNFNIPQRWSIAHLYQAILNGEDGLEKLDYITTLSGYMHRLLTGERVLGLGDASGMFPINSALLDYEPEYMAQFDCILEERGYPWRLADVLPRALAAGENAGRLTEAGALLLDPSGEFMPGVPLAPPEGDAATGMVATNSIRPGTGNVSAGTSVFAMIVCEKPIGLHREIDMVTTPAGQPVAMVHCNNCCSDIDAWIALFHEFACLCELDMDKSELYRRLFSCALEGEADCGGLLSFNYVSGEHITGIEKGTPLFLRSAGSSFNLPNFMRTQLLSALATLRIGLDILKLEEKVRIDMLWGHGGYFKTPEAGQRLMSAAVEAPVSVMETAGEGGAYGMAILAAYALWGLEEGLDEFLEKKVFSNAKITEREASQDDRSGFMRFLSRYKTALPVERSAEGRI